MFLRKYWLPISVFLIAIIGVGLYLLQTQPPKPPIVIYKAVEVEKKPKPPPPGETHETGHWHGDEWHKGSHDAHAQVTTPEVQGTPVDAPIAPPVNAQLQDPANAQIPAPTRDASQPAQESAQSTQESREAFEKWVAWTNKHEELAEAFSQASKALITVGPQTDEELKQYQNDPEWQRRSDEAYAKMAEIDRMLKAHEEKRVPPPGATQ